MIVVLRGTRPTYALRTSEIERVVDKQNAELRAMVAPKGVTIDLDPAARAWLAVKGFDRAFASWSRATKFGWLVDSGWW